MFWASACHCSLSICVIKLSQSFFEIFFCSMLGLSPKHRGCSSIISSQKQVVVFGATRLWQKSQLCWSIFRAWLSKTQTHIVWRNNRLYLSLLSCLLIESQPWLYCMLVKVWKVYLCSFTTVKMSEMSLFIFLFLYTLKLLRMNYFQFVLRFCW